MAAGTASRHRVCRIRALTAAILLFGAVSPAMAQRVGGAIVDQAVVVGSEAETYLRVLQVGGRAPAYPWSARGFSRGEVVRLLPDSAHPWAARTRTEESGGLVQGGLLRPSVRLTYNSAFPYGHNDGPVWTGRGMTAEVRAGLTASVGPLSLRVEPVAFWAENAEFELMPNRQTGRMIYAHGREPTLIDAPQRFGPGHYARVDLGESTLRLDVAGVVIGASTASQHWGPASENPIILGSNAGGFPHAFLGTSSPLNVGVGRVHGRVVWGSLAQSDYSVVEGHGSRRYTTGFVGVFTPRGLDHLELGASRFFHMAWPEGGLTRRDLSVAFQGITKASLDSTGLDQDGRTSADNQLASVFFRWVLPSTGLEVYGEFGREDHNWDVLDLTLEPDHNSGYMVGFRKVWQRDSTRLVSLRAEVLNTQIPHLVHARAQAPFYRHTRTRQGHTHRGQFLGSAFGHGGGGGAVSVDVYRPWGRWGVAWERGRMGDRFNYWRTGKEDDQTAEVIHSLAADGLLFTRGVQVIGGVTASAALNRHYRDDQYNLRAHVGVRLDR